LSCGPNGGRLAKRIGQSFTQSVIPTTQKRLTVFKKQSRKIGHKFKKYQFVLALKVRDFKQF